MKKVTMQDTAAWKTRLVIFVIAVVAVSVASFVVSRVVNYSLIDCVEIQQRSEELEKRGIATNLAPDVIDKCYR